LFRREDNKLDFVVAAALEELVEVVEVVEGVGAAGAALLVAGA
jgi:hypothetical protein